jgi:hypothetical protein
VKSITICLPESGTQENEISEFFVTVLKLSEWERGKDE